MPSPVSSKKYAATLTLAVLLGFWGIHRFYVGKVGTGILFLFTFGLFGIGWFIDIFTVLFRNFTDKTGSFVKPSDRRSEIMTDETQKKSGLPWWGWAIIAFVALGVISNLFGGDEETEVAETTVEEVVDEEAAPVDEVEEPVEEEIVGKPELLATCDGLNETTAAAMLAGIMADETTATLNDGVAEGTPEAFEQAVETIRESGEGYVELATIFRDADDCGDPKFAQLKNDLADTIESLGENYSTWSYDLLLSDESVLEEASVLLVQVASQSAEVGTYVDEAAG